MGRRTGTRRPKQTSSTGTRRPPPRRSKVPSAAATTASAATTTGTAATSDIPSSSPKEPENHPSDCQCFLKRVSQSLFLPPPAINTSDKSDKA
jgi:hypothetical protein